MTEKKYDFNAELKSWYTYDRTNFKESKLTF